MKTLSSVLALSTALFLGALEANAQTNVTGAINADNQFAVVVNYNGVPAQTVANTASTGYRWGTTKKFNFTIDETRANKCHVDVITWGDGGVREGMAGVFKGNQGTVFSGGPGFTALETNITRNFNFLSGSTITAIAGMNVSTSPTPITPVQGGQWGTVNSYNAGDFGGPVPGPTNFQWIKPQGAGTTSTKYYVYRIGCDRLVKYVTPPPPTDKGMTFGIRNPYPNDVNGVIHVGCGDKDGVNCDAIKGDTLCTTPKPLLCINPMGLSKPASVSEPSRWEKWSGGIVGTTNPIAAPDELSKANQACVNEFGSGWRVAQFHDGYAGRSGWSFSAYGNVGTKDKRFWADIDDQPNGVCWDRSK